MKHNRQGSRRRAKNKSLSRKDLIKTLSKFFADNKKRYYNARSIISKLDLKNSKDSVQSALEYMTQDKWIVAGSDNKFTWNHNNSMDRSHRVHPKKSFTGKVDITRTGAGYIIVDDMDDDIFVHPKNLKGAMNNDIVRVEMAMIPGKRKPEGKITEIIERSLSQVLGTIKNSGNIWTVYPASTEEIPEILIKEKHLNGAKDGDHVLLKISKWGRSTNKPFYGKILEVLEDQSDNDMAMQSILLDNGFELHFPQEVMDEAAAISREITDQEVARRRDMRETTTFTIDPETAKDFDDAISFKELENGSMFAQSS